ncbi:MAG: type IV pilus modification PilV family protein [Verrucomicrobiales bacterium]
MMTNKISKKGFTLLETVIAIGVLAVLLTGFMYVFAPAAAGIRKAITVQEADRLTSTLENEMNTLRDDETTEYATAFDKAFDWILNSNDAGTALLVYRYRSSIDGSGDPVKNVNTQIPGQDYVVRTMVRRADDTTELQADLEAVEGSVFAVKCTQLVFNSGDMELGTAGTIRDPNTSGSTVSTADDYPEAVIAFAAEFYILPSRSSSYFTSGGGFSTGFDQLQRPTFTRNLAVRR